MVVTPETVVIANYTAAFRPILVILKYPKSKVCEFPIIFLDVEDVRK